MSTETSARIRKGSCLCGDIKFEARGEPIRHHMCHCINCQKHSGSAFMSNFIYIGPENVNITDESNYLTSYDDKGTTSGAPLQRNFCSNCGSSVFIRPVGTPVMVICTGTLDNKEDRDLPLTHEIFCISQQSWWEKVSSELDVPKSAGSGQQKKGTE